MPKVNGGLHNVSATGGSSSANATFTEVGALWFSRNGVDVGQNVTAAGGGFGSSVAITMFTLGNDSLNCTGATVGTCTSGTITTDIGGFFNAKFVAPSVNASGSYNVTATDSQGTSENGNLTVDLDPQVSNPTAAPNSIDLGQMVTLSTNATLGSGGYSYRWSGLPGCSGTTRTFRCTPTAVGNANVSVAVNDSNGFSVSSGTLSFSVEPDPSVAPPNASSGPIDVNQSVTFTAIATGGSGVYLSYTWMGLPNGCSGSNATVLCTPTSGGSGPVSVSVTDSNGRLSPSSGSIPFTVYPDPVVSTPSANRSSADIGQDVEFDGSVGLGSGGYSYVWTGLPSGCSGTSPTIDCRVRTAENSEISLKVNDSNGYRATSDPLSFQTYPDPIVALVENRSSADPGQQISWDATVVNGSGGTTYHWKGLPAECPSSGARVTCAVVVAGTYSVTVTVEDSNGVSAVSAPVNLSVATSLRVSIEVGEQSATVGESLTFVSSAVGGTGPITYSWSFGDGSTSIGPTVNHSYEQTGSYGVLLWVNDSIGGSAKASIQVTVSESPISSPPSTSSSPVAPWLIIAVVVGIGAIGLAYFVINRRRRNMGDPNALSEEADGEETSF